MPPTFAVVGAIVVALGYFLLKRRGTVNSTDARRIVEAGGRLVDVRTPREFANGHIASAINIPIQDLKCRMAELEEKTRPIVLYCRSGRRSGSAARMLKNAGYVEVHDLGSMNRW